MKISRFLLLIIVSTMLLATGYLFSCTSRAMAKSPQKSPMAPEYFGIYTATLDGKHLTEIIRDPIRQISHARVSNDHKWITFSRFNKLNRFGVAFEEDGYFQTEIMISRTDGSELEAIVPAKRGIGNFNSYWTPDDKGIVYISTDNTENIAQIYTINLATRKITRVPTPKGFHASDPHMRGKFVVYPGRRRGEDFSIRIMNADGANDRQLTSTPGKRSYGEFDPKISPDLSKVAFTRFVTKKRGKGAVHIIVVDLKTGVTTDLTDISQPSDNENMDSFPEWSSDNKLLVFWHINRKRPVLKSGIYTIRPDGSERRKIPLPLEYLYSFASFWPGTGSGKDAKIIFSVRRLPEKIRRKLQKLQK